MWASWVRTWRRRPTGGARAVSGAAVVRLVAHRRVERGERRVEVGVCVRVVVVETEHMRGVRRRGDVEDVVRGVRGACAGPAAATLPTRRALVHERGELVAKVERGGREAAAAAAPRAAVGACEDICKVVGAVAAAATGGRGREAGLADGAGEEGHGGCWAKSTHVLRPAVYTAPAFPARGAPATPPLDRDLARAHGPAGLARLTSPRCIAARSRPARARCRPA